MIATGVCVAGSFFDDSFDAAVGDEPHAGDADVEAAGDPRLEECRADSQGVKNGREFSFEVVADGSGEF